MAVETEVKLRIRDPESWRGALRGLGARLERERHFEDNFVLDYADGRLRMGRSMLRVRSSGPVCTVTYKGPPLPAGPFKQREEHEFQAGDQACCLEIFGKLGLSVWFRYQKYREEYEMSRESGSVKIALDETPIGLFAEIEGPGQAIREAAASMGFQEADFLRDSYYGLYCEECRTAGVEPANMVFPDATT